MLRLIEATDGDVVGADIPTVIRTLGDAIFHVHAKDIRTNDWIAARDGLLDTVPITEPDSRAWNYVTHGLGHPGGATFWADFVYNLRSVGYDGTLSIEHEDALVNSVEGVGRAADLLRHVALVDPPDWTPAKV
jgi:sugar phosphate isomerase/epimerase